MLAKSFYGMALVASMIATALLEIGVSASSIALDEDFMDIVLELIRLPYQGGSTDKYDLYKEYSSLADDAVLARTKEGRCFVYFVGTNGFNPHDIVQNFQPGFTDVCPKEFGNNSNTVDCCRARRGFNAGYFAPYVDELEADISQCISSCPNPDDCLYLTGHSQGGSNANVAGIVWKHANPFVVTFANGRTLNEHCTQLNATRWIRFVNTRSKFYAGLIYDIWPFFHQIDHQGYNHGTTYILSDDTSNLATVSVNAYESIGPLDWTQIAHAIDFDVDWLHLGAGYINRLERLVENNTFPISSDGFETGFYCTRDEECKSKSCEAAHWGLTPWIRRCM